MKKALKWVLSIHLIFLTILLGDHWIKRERPPKKALVIRSVSPPKSFMAAQITKQPASKATAPKPTAPKSNSKAPAKKTTSSPKPASKAPVKAEKPSLTVPSLPKMEVPQLPQIITAPVPEENSDPNILVASYLQELLQLPEFGEVKVLLKINEQGIVSSLEVLESKSEKNKEFLKNRLAEISFPWLNEETELTIVFRNE